MGLVDAGYQPWSGDLQGRLRRIGAMVRVEIGLAFQGALTRLMLALTYTIVVVFIGILYIVASTRTPIQMALGNNLYREYLNSWPYQFLLMLLTAIVGARLISRDVKTNAVSMYLSKAITRGDYLAAKFAVISLFLLSATLAPSLSLWIGQLAMGQEELSWGDRLADLGALTAHSLVIVIPMSAAILALSSLSRKAYVPGILWLLIHFGSFVIGTNLEVNVKEEWCKLVSWQNLTAHLGNSFYAIRDLKMKTPLMSKTHKFEPLMSYGWEWPAVILGAIVLLSGVVVLWRLRTLERNE